MAKKKKDDNAPEFEAHEPQESPTAAISLELHHPEFVGTTPGRRDNAAWDVLHEARRKVMKGVQVGLSRAFVAFTKARNLPADKFEGKDWKPQSIIYHALVEAGLSENGFAQSVADQASREFEIRLAHETKLASSIADQVSRTFAKAEFSGGKDSKGSRVASGEIMFPRFSSPNIQQRAEHWTVEVVERQDEQGNVWHDPVVTIDAPLKGSVKMRLDCKSIYGKGSASQLAVLRKLAEIPAGESRTPYGWGRRAVLDKEGNAVKIKTGKNAGKEKTEWFNTGAGWKRGDLKIVFNRKDKRWSLKLAYGSPRTEREVQDDTYIVVHRGIANFLTALIVQGDEVKLRYLPGEGFARGKVQFHARRQRVNRALHSLEGRGRGRGDKFRAMRGIRDYEERFTRTEMQRAARFVQRLVEESGARVVYVESFTDIVSDLTDERNRYVQMFIRKIPLASLKSMVIDAVTRRAGVRVVEVPSHYVSRTCPACGHEDEQNVRRLPRVFGDGRSKMESVEPVLRSVADGKLTVEQAVKRLTGPSGASTTRSEFQCVECGAGGDLDYVAVCNMLVRAGEQPGRALDGLDVHDNITIVKVDAFREVLKQEARNMNRERSAGSMNRRA
jgi:transposase